MNINIITTIQNLISTNGRDIYTDSKKLKAFLNDYFPGQYTRDVRLLCDSVEQKITEDIVNCSEVEVEVDNFTYNKLVTKLYDNLGVSQELAVDTVDAWIHILGKTHKPMGTSMTGGMNINKSRPGTALSETSQHYSEGTMLIGNNDNKEQKSKEVLTDNKKKIIVGVLTGVLVVCIGVASALAFSNKKTEKADNKDTKTTQQVATVANTQEKKAEAPQTKEAKAPDIVTVQNLITNYEKAKMDAINKNNFALLDAYLLSGSKIQSQDRSTVEALGSRCGQQQLLISYNIKDIKREGNDYKVDVHEKHTMFAAGNPDEREYECTYIIGNVNNKWGLTDCLKNTLVSNNTNSAMYNNASVKSDTYYVNYAISNYLYGIVDAVNRNDFSRVAPYLIPGSKLYSDQQKLIVDLNRQNIKESLVEYEILDIVPLGGNYKIKTHEKYIIDYNGNPKQKEFTCSYIVRNTGGSWALSEMLN